MIEFFAKIVNGVQLFSQKASSMIFDWVLTTPLERVKPKMVKSSQLLECSAFLVFNCLNSKIYRQYRVRQL